MTHKEANSQLEQIVDSIGLSQLLTNLASICYEKGSHLRENWQDNASAKTWDSAGQKIDRLAFNDTVNSL